MPDPLSLIPAGSKYDILRWTLRHLRALGAAGYGTDYAGLANQPDRIRGWVAEIDAGSRSADDIRDDIVQYVIGEDLAREAYGLDAAGFQRLIAGGNEGGINFSDVSIRPRETTQPRPAPDPTFPVDTPTPPAPPPTPPEVPDPTPPPGSEPEPSEPVDYQARVRTLYPWLPSQLASIFADAWADTGDPSLALAEMRSSGAYETYYPGNRRSDGTLRHTEAEYTSIKEAYRTLYREFGLNPDLFEGRLTELIEKEQSPAEHARKLGAAYENIINNIPELRQVYAQYGGIQMTDEAIFASVIDPDIGEAIVNQRISVAAVGAEGLARGFGVGQPFAERLANAGVNQAQAREFFSEAEDRLPTFDELARRFRDPDPTFDLDEFAEAAVFGGAAQSRRIRRLLAAESSTFTDQLGGLALGDDFELGGLSAR